MAITKLLRLKESKKGNPAQHLINNILYICDREKTDGGLWIGGNAGQETATIISTMVVMGRSLKAYDAALDLLIEVMELLRDSLMEMVEIHYGLNAYEEFLKDNRAAEKAKEMRPDMVEREMLSEEDHEKQEVDRAMQKEDSDNVMELEDLSQQEEKRRER